MGRASRWTALSFSSLTVLAVALAATSAAASTDTGAPDALASFLSIEVTGASEATTARGGVRADPVGDLAEVLLSAEALRIEHAWQQTARVSPLGMQVVYDQGWENVSLGSATVRFGASDGPPLLFADLDGGSAEMRAVSADGMGFAPLGDVPLVGVGMRPGAAQAGNGPGLGYWYTTQGPCISAEAVASVTVQGSFTLFVHNVTVEASGTEGSWSAWTGYREGRPGQAVTDAELRVTVLHVENGTLVLPTRTAVRIGSSEMSVALDGTVAFGSVSGLLRVDGGALSLEQDPLTLTGGGDLVMTAGRGAHGGLPLIRVEPSGALEVVSTLGEWEGPAGPTPARPGRMTVAAVALAFGAAGVAGMTELSLLPGPTPGRARKRHARWMRRGRRASLDGRWSWAAWCYRTAARTKRHDPLAWYDWAVAEFQAGRWSRADDVARRAADVPGIDHLDLLEIRASCAYRGGEERAFTAHLGRLARQAPDMAIGLVEDLDIDVLSLPDPFVRHLLRPTTEGPLDGYA